MKKFYFLFLLFFSSQFVFAQNNILIDLTYPFNEKTIYWPTHPGFELKKYGWKKNSDGYFYAGNTFSAPEHGGTHIDAPIHFNEKGFTVEKIPLTQLYGDLIKIDLSSKIKNQFDYEISKTDILNWEKEHREITANDIVFFHTGWDRFWPNQKKYLGNSNQDINKLKFPGFGESAVNYLVFKKVKGVGIDTASLDPGHSKDFMAHRILAKNNIYGIENLAWLNKVPNLGAKVMVAPMKITEGTGAPVRVLAILPSF